MFAHSVKNPDIRHYFIYDGHSGVKPNREPTRYRYLSYLCMPASSTTPSKRTRDVSEVTCLNCLRKLKKKGVVG